MSMLTKEEQAALEAEQKAKEEEAAKAAAESGAKDDETTDADKTAEEESIKQLEAELERERKAKEDERLAREKAEKALAEKRFKNSEKKRLETIPDEDEDEEERPMTRREFLEALAQERIVSQKERLESEANRLAASMSENDTVKQLVIAKWKSITFPSHYTLEEQIESCYAIANRKKIVGVAQEALRALKSKDGVNSDGSSTHRDAPAAGQPKLAGNDAAEMARVGFKWSGTNRRYEKKLANGKILVRDPRTGKTQIV